MLKLFDPIATLNSIPANRLTLLEREYQSIQSLPAGQVGTIVEIYETEDPSYLIEFADLQGHQ
ncbi:DUF4926 domain-containing protein [Leptolyngbya sp. FACHB-671]|uniref:DUF4926 domain-containing protein n=1 Tax=Leptolyngbya sp. FACHB-671 TaxID=2692812 RepID=UPI001683ADBE|nr:DUF4926 domain-containing protein [Leptolyngbya sp. FACHB-671]MBD2067052.1 DUF4926 domain-containing protein [Leptolyngbya sp. FACHB-671]